MQFGLLYKDVYSTGRNTLGLNIPDVSYHALRIRRPRSTVEVQGYTEKFKPCMRIQNLCVMWMYTLTLCL